MKRPESIIFAFMAAAAVSCTIDEPASDTGAISDGGFVIEAGIMGSKTVFTPPVSVEWASSDELSVLVAGGNYRFVKTADGDNSFSSVDFSPEEGVEYTYNVFYPYYDGFSAVDESGLAQGLVSLPYGGCDVQASTSDASHVKGFLAGTATAAGMESPSVSMSHLTSVIAVTVNNTGERTMDVSSIALSTDAEGAVLSGNFSVDFDNCRLAAVSETSSETVLEVTDGTIAAGESGIFYITVPEFTVPQGNNITVTVDTRAGSRFPADKPASETLVFSRGGVYNTAVDIAEVPMMNGSVLKDIKDDIEACCWDSDGVNDGVWIHFENGQEVQVSGIYDLDEVYNRDFFSYDPESGILTYTGETQDLDVLYSSVMGYIWLVNDGADTDTALWLDGYGFTQAPRWSDILTGAGWNFWQKFIPQIAYVPKTADNTYSVSVYVSDEDVRVGEGMAQMQLVSRGWTYYTVTPDEAAANLAELIYRDATETEQGTPTIRWKDGAAGYYRISFTVDHEAATAVMSAQRID